MRLATFVPHDAEDPRAGTVADGRVTAFADERLTVLDVLGDPALAQGAAARGEGGAGGRTWPLEEVTLLAPVPAPRAIFGIGLNYADHVAETGGERPAQPLVFMKLPSSAAPPGAPVRCPAVVRRLDYEGELAVVMGAAGRVAGYAVADDVCARDLQGREPQWTRAKGADGFCPYGPWITTAEEVPDPHALRLRTWVNGALRQDSSTSNLIFTVPELRGLHRRDLHALPRRPDPHRHPLRRRPRPGPARLPLLRVTWCASRSRGSGRSSTGWPEATEAPRERTVAIAPYAPCMTTNTEAPRVGCRARSEHHLVPGLGLPDSLVAEFAVLPVSYTRAVAKVMISIPDTLLDALDAEARRRGTSRSALLQAGARREVGLLRREPSAVLSDLDELSRTWEGPLGAAELVRAERLRDG